MKVKVIKAGLSSYWYADKIGEVFEVKESDYPNWQYKLVSDENFGSYFDKNDVEIINEEKQMKKSDLKTGMRVVHGKHPRCTEPCIVVNDLNKILFKDGGYNIINSYNEDLKNGGVWDITEVYAAPKRDILNFDVEGDLLWKREEKTAEQIQIDKVMDQIAELQYQASQLQELINK